MTAFALSPQIRIQLRHTGNERNPLMIIDNVLANPQALIDTACATDFYVPEHTRYPGLNAPLPDGYYRHLITALRGPIEAAFGLSHMAWISYFGFFALATIDAESAAPIQKIPHFDSPDGEQLAMVHYLCRGDYGGTGFFRHDATGFESVDAEREAAYIASARADLDRTQDSRSTYAGAGMTDYTQVGEAEMVFDRLIMYRSNVLHSGLLNHAPLSDDPATGRLTANGFIRVSDA